MSNNKKGWNESEDSKMKYDLLFTNQRSSQKKTTEKFSKKREKKKAEERGQGMKNSRSDSKEKQWEDQEDGCEEERAKTKEKKIRWEWFRKQRHIVYNPSSLSSLRITAKQPAPTKEQSKIMLFSSPATQPTFPETNTVLGKV